MMEIEFCLNKFDFEEKSFSWFNFLPFMLQRSIRGIPCDVWVAEASDENDKQDTDTKYKTVELYFSRPDWHILVEEINSLSQLPLGMRTYIADSVKQKLKESRKKISISIFVFQKNASQFNNKITSHYYEFNPSNPMWKYFDVTSCLAQLDKLYLKVTLDGILLFD